MKTPKRGGKHANNMELLKQQASACGPGCGCHATGIPGKTRWVIGSIVLVVAGVLVVRAMNKSDGALRQTTSPAFASLAASQTPAGGSGVATSSAVAARAAETSVGTTIGAFAELNTAAAKPDAVFVFLPGKEGSGTKAPSAPMKSAARAIEARGMKCALFTLKPGSPDYDQIAAQMAVPGVLALVKGRGMSAVSGDITESKLLQGFVAASSAGCGPSAGAGCCPK